MSTVLERYHTGVDEHPSSSFAPIEVDESDKKTQSEIEEWAWKVHEVALHDAGQREGPLRLSNVEMLLKRVSEEVTRKAQERHK